MLHKLIWVLALALAAQLSFVAPASAGVNINTASKDELIALPGIGPAKAQAIVDYRNANGRFKSLEDLKKVNGIGDATFDKLKPDVSLTGKTTPVAAPMPGSASSSSFVAVLMLTAASARLDSMSMTMASRNRFMKWSPLFSKGAASGPHTDAARHQRATNATG